MFYEVRATMYFTKEDEARDFYYDCEMALPKASVINPDTPTAQHSRAELIENHHDSEPTNPCLLLEFITNGPIA